MEGEVRIATRAPTGTAVVAATTTWDEFPRLWRELLAEVWAACARPVSPPAHEREDQDPALFETEVYWLLAE